jgi:hypothetical protein
MSGFDDTSYTVRTVTGTTDTLTASDYIVIYTSTSAKTVNLPPVATTPPGRVYQVICTTTGALTFDGNASETINGSTTLALTANTANGFAGRATIVSDGTQWLTVIGS